ncbi:hypothetical protein [Moorena sp. SIO4G3]|uniref:hypothetical protein n=1 Tax=Moorena sp. SIO4G3 TaxID=2607821 RepID=UPI0014297129|nr:hypothetical protein [Moorena sp. SIO4G3]NEO82118.1 hypothetical protein [Moorena sp. SIO4G3]
MPVTISGHLAYYNFRASGVEQASCLLQFPGGLSQRTLRLLPRCPMPDSRFPIPDSQF